MMNEIQYEYLQDGENATIIESSKNKKYIITKNNKGDIIYENNQGVELKNDIIYNEDGSKIITNNFFSKYIYDSDNRLLEMSNAYGDKRTYDYNFWESNCKTEETIETLNGEINKKTTEVHIGDDKIKLTTNYHVGFDREPSENYLFNLGSNLGCERKEFEQYHDNLIHRRTYDENNNIIEDKTYNCVSTRMIDYDDNQNKISEKTYTNNNDLIYVKTYENKYDNDNRLIKQIICDNDTWN